MMARYQERQTLDLQNNARSCAFALMTGRKRGDTFTAVCVQHVVSLTEFITRAKVRVINSLQCFFFRASLPRGYLKF